jgi:DNA modification methylase
MKPKILEEFKNLITPLQKEQKEALKQNIKTYGLREPLIVWTEENVLVDGHNRYEICEELKIEPKYVFYSFKDRFEVLSFIIENQIIRRNLQPYEKIEIYAKLKDDLNRLGFSKKPSSEGKKHNTLLIIAEKTGYSHDTLHKAFYIDKNGNEDLKKDLRSGKISINQAYGKLKKISTGGLKDKFVFPPFSILDSSSADWICRKREWFNTIGSATETRDGEFGRTSVEEDEVKFLSHINSGTSVFDPVLCEVLVRWFSKKKDSVLDPFAGSQVRGAVCGLLDRNYRGVEIRGDQINANELVMRNLGVSDKVSYVEGDSVNLSSLLKGEYFDMCLTCPPYYNLEIYSKKDLSAMGTYAEFIENYSKILKDACLLLKNNSFFVIVVGDLRNDEGAYYGFVYDTIRILLDSKLKLYNEIILKNSIGTAAVRAANSMKTKKITKIHQNVLVFYKGDIKKIDKTPVDLSDI